MGNDIMVVTFILYKQLITKFFDTVEKLEKLQTLLQESQTMNTYVYDSLR